LQYVYHWGSKLTTRVDDADLVEGGPGGFQVVGRNLKDEDLIEIAKIVSETLKTSGRQ